MERLLALGIGLVFLGFILIFIASLSGAKSGESKVAVVGLLGPIPFGFGNDKKWFLITLGIAIAVFVFWNVFARQLA